MSAVAPDPADLRLLVLMYHGLHRDDAGDGRFDPRYSVRPEAFDRQMRRLRELRGSAWLPTPEGASAQPARGAAVMVSFDDGAASDAEVALPCLQSLGLRAAFFITSGFVGRPGMLSPGQVRELADAGMLVGAHGATHRFLNTLDDAALRDELVRSRAALEDMTGRPVDTLALPGGRGGERELKAAQAAGYRLVFGSAPGLNRGLSPAACVRRVAITRGMGAGEFDQVLAWQGATVRRLRLRHRLLSVPKQLLGDDRYDRLRQAIVR